ncbi:MAG TPA: DUF494 domain-containing protein [Firmicutes bacterium]|nr:DUF494 domain-containing protein [Bacillota bacterium]
MNERVMEIVNLLIKLILQDGRLPDSGATLVNDLLARGYEASEIDAAFNLVFSLPDISLKPGATESPPPRRVLDAEERMKLSVGAQGALETLSRLGIITVGEMDELLFYLSQIDAVELDLPDIMWLLERVIRDRDRLKMALGFDWSTKGRHGRRRVH